MCFSFAEDSFRQRLVNVEKEVILLREENARLRANWDCEKKRSRDLESRLVNAESANTSLQRRVEAFCDAKLVLENELDEKELALNQQKKEAKRAVRRLRSQISAAENREPQHPSAAPGGSKKRSMEARRLEGEEDDEDAGEQRQEAFRGVGSRIAEMEARCAGKKIRH